MEAEEIIQQKEWFELNAGDHAILKDLVADEQEYNLLKKMMQVAAEEVDQVPAVSPLVQQQLLVELQSSKTKRNNRLLYYAAAAIIVVLFATWLLNRTGNPIASKDKDAIASGIPEKEKITQLPEIRKDSSQMNNELTVTRNENKRIAPVSRTNKLNEKRIPRQPVNTTNLASKINTALSNDSNLMAMITEVY